MDVYLEEIVLFNERIINMITKSKENVMVLYPIITEKNTLSQERWFTFLRTKTYKVEIGGVLSIF